MRMPAVMPSDGRAAGSGCSTRYTFYTIAGKQQPAAAAAPVVDGNRAPVLIRLLLHLHESFG